MGLASAPGIGTMRLRKSGLELRLKVAKKTQRMSIGERIRSWRSVKGKKRPTARSWNWLGIVKVAVVVCFLAASGAFLRYAEAYMKLTTPAEEGSLILVGVPEWVDWDLKARVAAVAGGTRFPLQDDTAAVLARNLAPMSWLDDVRIQVTHDSVRVKAQWRKPVALIEIEEDSSRIYVDENLVVLDYMPMSHLPIVEIKGMDLGVVPLPGQVFDQNDLAAAVTLIVLLHRMDAEYAPVNPLLEHIASIDITNFRGRRNRREPHIVLHTKDDTQIIWGAEIGEWAKYLEAKDEQKLAKLYSYYREFGSLSAGAKYINLRDPQDRVPQPIDKYR